MTAINRYVFGNPIETGAIVKKPESSLWEKPEGLSFLLKEEDIVYGLGQSIRGINKRGWIYVNDCADDPVHSEDKKSLYGAHNFLMISGETNCGFFLDTPAKVTFDIGYTKYDTLRIIPESTDYELYMIYGETPDEVIGSFRKLIGRSYIAPRWAFGYIQSRWGYDCSEDIREVAEKHRQNHIPLDGICMDIDYMEQFEDFTIDRNTFPDFESLVMEMKQDNIHLIPIIDGGVKKKDGYEIYEEGKKNNYFCKDQEGEDFVIGVWPGKCCFPDMLNEDASKWFGSKYKILMDKGIDGFWNDMNEPAIFYSEKRLKKVFEKIADYQKMNLDVTTFFEFRELVDTLANNPEDYASFYHNYRGQKIRHDKVHNLFGFYMTKAASDAFREIEPEKRTLLFSRSSYIGMHRYGGIWQGDNMAWWSHLLLTIKMMPSLNMCGFLYTGSDIGGFGADTTEDLLLRWIAFSVFVPLMRNHACRGTRQQEVYQFTHMDLLRDEIAVRYRLLPYIYSEYMKAALRGTMMFRPLGFIYQDKIARHIEDQLMIGDSIMIAPVYEQNAIGRNVYCPERMKLLRFSHGAMIEEAEYEQGFHFIEVPMGDIILFLREGYLLPISTGGESVEEVDFNNLKLLSFGMEVKPYEYYCDDGISMMCSEDNVQILSK